MSRTPREVASDIIRKLNVTDPSISAEVGTPERKIIDAVAEAISESYVENYIVQNIWDINQKTGEDLDEFVSLFGFGRYEGKRANGVVRFTISDPAIQRFEIPYGTRVYVESTDVDEPIYYTTIQPDFIPVDSTFVDIPVQAVEVGVQGNTARHTVVGFETYVGVASVNNLEPIIGGRSIETDQELRERFTNTFLRNVAGTEDFYRGICLAHQNVSRVAVYGPISRYHEQLQIKSGSFTSENNHSKYTWPLSTFVSTSLAEDITYKINGVDYNVLENVPPVFSVISGRIPNNTVVQVEHEYTSKASRNEPGNSITNKVDVYIDGVEPVMTTESTVFSSETLQASTSSPLGVSKFKREGTGARPVAGNRFQRLGSVPLVTVPNNLEVYVPSSGSIEVYKKGIDFHVVKDDTIYRGSEKERSGIEWVKAPPTAGTPVNFVYTYNRAPEVLNGILKQSKQLTTDPLVHEARKRYLTVQLTVILAPGVTQESVRNGLSTTFTQWFSSLPIGTWVQLSDVEALAHNVTGVDAVRLGRPYDGFTNEGVLTVQENGSLITSHKTDFQLNDDEFPVLFDLNIRVKSFNTFGIQ